MQTNKKSAAALVHRQGRVNGNPCAASSFWSTSHRDDYYRANYQQWLAATVAGQATRFRLTGAPSTNWIVSDPEDVCNTEQWVNSAPLELRSAFRQIQSAMMLDLEEWMLGLQLPYVLVTEDLGPMSFFRCKFRGALPSINQLPDFRAYVESESDFPMYALAQQFAIPLKTWLPASIDGSRCSTPAFYSIESSAMAIVAIMESAIDSRRQIELVRRCKDRDGKSFELAVVTVEQLEAVNIGYG